MADSARLAVLKAAVVARVPAVLCGPPGCGKTETVHSLAAAWRVPCLTLALAGYSDAADVAGILFANGGGLRRDLPPATADFFDQARRAGGGLLFWDELNCARPMVAAVAQRALSEWRLGDHAIPACVAQLAAVNPAESSTIGNDLPPAVANRLAHVDWEPDYESWANWAARRAAGQKGLATVGNQPLSALPGPLPELNSISAFVRARRRLCAFPASEELRSRPWPSPRTWELAARLLTALDGIGLRSDETRRLALGCTVGQEAAGEYLAWLAEEDAPRPEAILASPDSWVPPSCPFRAHAALGAVVALAVERLTAGDVSAWERAWRAVGAVSDVAPDAALLCAGPLINARPTIQGRRVPYPASFEKLGPLLRALPRGDNGAAA